MLSGNTSRPTLAKVPETKSETHDLSQNTIIEFAHVLHSKLSLEAVLETIAEKMREYLDCEAAAVLVRERAGNVLKALNARTPELATGARELTHSSAVQDLVSQAISSRGPALGSAPDSLGGGTIFVVPLNTSRTEAALLLLFGDGRTLSEQQKSLSTVLAGLGAFAVSNCELLESSQSKANELQQLLDISAGLHRVSDLDCFLQQFPTNAASFLGFERAFIALREGDGFVIRWIAEQGTPQALRCPVPRSIAARILSARQPVWSDDLPSVPDSDQEKPAISIKQYVASPLKSSDGNVLGLLAVLERCDGRSIEAEDIRRAQALAAEASVALQAVQNLHSSEQNRRQAEELISLALELNSSLRVPNMLARFTARAESMLGARGAVLALVHRSDLRIVEFSDPNLKNSWPVIQALTPALSQAARRSDSLIASGPTAEILGSEAASATGWDDVTVAKLISSSGVLQGVLCLVNRGESLDPENATLLQAVCAHAAVAIENSILFTRMEQANRHWIEIFDAITDFIVVHDEMQSILRVNRSLADFIGVKPQDLIGVSISALLAMTAEHGAQGCPFCRIESSESDEWQHAALDRTYLVSTSRIHGTANEGSQTIHVLKDITDRREAERRYRELFDSIQEGLFFSSPDGRFVEVNDALVRMLGYESREELLQVDIPAKLYLNPDQRQRFRALIDKKGSLRNYEEALRRKDGSLVYTLQNAFAVRDSQERVVQYRGLMLDITDLKTFQSELQRERDFNSKILNNTQSMILVADTAGLISYANRRWFEAGGYSEISLLGRRLVDLIAPNRHDAIKEALDVTLSGQQVDNLEVPVVLGTGRVGQFSVNLSPMRDEQGNVNSIVVVMTDITDAAMLQAKLMHTEKMAAVGQLVSGVAHEVNNPLTAVLGFADLLLENPRMPEDAKADLRIIMQEAQRTKQIVQNLLSFARQTPAKREMVDVNEIVRRTLALRAYDFANHDVHIIERLDETIPTVMGDPHQLQQVFLNILNNAYDAVTETGRSGQIEIRTCYRAGFVEVSLRDNGPGIKNPERIFDPFFTTKEVGKGTGLGLSICYGIVNEHEGEIMCANNGEQAGATFVVRLPVTAHKAAFGTAAGESR